MAKKNDDLSKLATRLARYQANWLSKEFAAAAVNRDAPEKVTLSLPTLYTIEPLHRLARSGRVRGTLHPVEITAGTLEDAVGTLYDKLMVGFTTARGQPMELAEYVPQQGQVFGMDVPYEFIRHDDPEHDHGSIRLINLLPVYVEEDWLMRRRHTSRGSLCSGDHFHLLIK